MVASIADIIYKGFIGAFKIAGKVIVGLTEAVLLIIKGVMYLICQMVAMLVALITKIISAVGNALLYIARNAWEVIKSVTGFVWSMLVSAAKSPITWGAITTAGVAVAPFRPIIGVGVAAVGGIGLLLTL